MCHCGFPSVISVTGFSCCWNPRILRFASSLEDEQMSERCNLSTCLWGQTIETQALGIHPQKAVLACRYEGCALGLSCRTMSWADALGRALGKPSGPDVALKSVFITAELGEVMLAWCHFSVNHLKDSWGGFGSKETQKTWAEIKSFDLGILL